MQRAIHAVIRPGEQSGYVAVCDQLHAVTQGATLDEVASNLGEVIALALSDEDLHELRIAPPPVVLAAIELSLA